MQLFGGRGQSRGSGSIGRTAAQDKALRKIARQTGSLKKEQYRIVDKDGNVVFAAKGEKDKVTMTVGEKRQYLNGNVSIHNHPDDGTFSSSDLSDFGYGAVEISAATQTGTYRLINMKHGTKDQSTGWMKMRDNLESQSWFNNGSAIENRKKASQNIANSKEAKQMTSLSEQWVAERKKGASQSKLDSIYAKYTKAEETYKKKLAAEVRKVETEPFHQYYKKNAAKYGFKYVYEPKG